MSGPADSVPTGAGVERVILPLERDLGGFTVGRALPTRERRAVGPFVFLDLMGPVVMQPGHDMDVRPHPHIGLATVTYLLAGEIMHRDSLGSVQRITPGDVNWMTAGRGIVHSERTPPELRGEPQEMFGLQFWVALPRDKEEIDPSFVHHPESDLPVLEGEGSRIRLVAGSLFGKRSPVATMTETILADIALDEGARTVIPAGHEERALQLVEGAVEIGGAAIHSPRLIVLEAGREVTVAANSGPARLVLLGGDRLDGPRHLWWNFVASSKERIEAAKADWKNGRFPPVPGETEFIPLPE